RLTPLTFLVPGRLDQLTGGYLFDRRVVDRLREGGRKVEVVELAGSFPDADAMARAAFEAALARLPDVAAAVIDGLALLGPAARQAGPARVLAVASVTPRKGHLVLIAALARLGELDWRLRCVGSLTRDPAAVTALRQAIAQHGLADRVTLVGERPTGELAAEY